MISSSSACAEFIPLYHKIRHRRHPPIWKSFRIEIVQRRPQHRRNKPNRCCGRQCVLNGASRSARHTAAVKQTTEIIARKKADGKVNSLESFSDNASGDFSKENAIRSGAAPGIDSKYSCGNYCRSSSKWYEQVSQECDVTPDYQRDYSRNHGPKDGPKHAKHAKSTQTNPAKARTIIRSRKQRRPETNAPAGRR